MVPKAVSLRRAGQSTSASTEGCSYQVINGGKEANDDTAAPTAKTVKKKN